MAGTRTEKPTPERRRKAREEGQFPRGRDATSIAATLGVLLVLASTATLASDELHSLAARCFGDPLDLVRGDGKGVAARALHALAVLILPASTAAMLGATLVGFAEAGWHPKLALVLPRWDRLEPLGKLKTTFAPGRMAVESVLALARVGAVGYVVYATVEAAFPLLCRLADSSLSTAVRAIADTVGRLALRSSLALAVLAGADYLVSRMRIEKQLMMSREEIKEELKQHEGDQRIKARQRAKARDRIKKAIARAVKKADVVVTNPTHVAVALRYRPAEGAPIVVAKGYDEIALHIRELARESSVEIVEMPPLARALAARVKVGRVIPVDLYAAVAEVLAFVYRLRGGRAAWA